MLKIRTIKSAYQAFSLFSIHFSVHKNQFTDFLASPMDVGSQLGKKCQQ